MKRVVRFVCLLGGLALIGCAGTEPRRTPYAPNMTPGTVPGMASEQTMELPQSLSPRLSYWKPLIGRLAGDGIPVPELYAVFSRPEAVFDPEPMNTKLRSLYKLQFGAEMNRRIQMGLTQLGYTPGGIDGLAGDNTRRAIEAFEEVHGLTPTGEPTKALLTLIEAELAQPAGQRRPARATLVTQASSSGLYESLVTRTQLGKCEEFGRTYQSQLYSMEQTFGVPAEVAVAILMVETRLGTYTGNRNAFTVLSSMALSQDFSIIAPYLVSGKDFNDEELAWLALKAKEKGEWAYKELKALLIYCLDNGHDPLSLPASIYGAVGHCQFMPSNVLAYGRDGDGDGRVNLFTMPDAIHSIGSYLRENGWQGDMSAASRRRAAIFSYNRSERYVNTVLHIADKLKGRI